MQQLHLYLGGNSCKLENPEMVLGTLHYTGSLLGYEVIDHTERMDQINGFTNLVDYINSQEGFWVINDTCPVHLPITVDYIVIFRDTTWVWPTKLQGRCIGVITQAMIVSAHGPLQIAQILAQDKEVVFPFRAKPSLTYHVVSDYEDGQMDTFGRNAFAAHSWHLLSKRDLHYRLIRVDNAMLVADIVLEAFDHCDDGDMVIFTNRDICLVPEASAILWAFMINRGLSICYNQRVETFSQVPLLAKDIEHSTQYTGIDTFVFIKGLEAREFLKKAKQFKLEIGRASWDIAWIKMIDGVSGHARCPYNITYHVPHNSLWQMDREINENNSKEASKLMQGQGLGIADIGLPLYKAVPWVY